ncbi:FkbM family methyltransferase [Hyphomicrobium sp.]|uniref:FkbM family methyltransferase n=1 Tax=Hyphomicrobium sp. TaxID=82 RepID=UPI0025BACA7B|nr:FkbM family methyltransferase [Hyphomicrobium sp.]MCC7253994.1 FkbM family methyltransferase [Hyphomicrobium sp.]
MLAGALSATAVGPGPAGSARHASRHFNDLPDAHGTEHLLRELNGGLCRFAPRLPKTPLGLYGGGNMGRLARDYLEAVDLDLAFVVDRHADRLRTDPVWSGTPLYAPEDVPGTLKSKALLAVSVTTAPFVPLEAALHASGWADVVPFYDLAESFRDRHPLSNGWFAEPLDAESFERTIDVLRTWDDDVSRAHHLQFLAWRRPREEWSFEGAPVTLHDRFFIPEVTASLGSDEVFLDGGAHHGSVTQTFIGRTAGRFSSVVAIEPDEQSRLIFEQLLGTLDPATATRITLLPHALDAAEREQSFHGGLGYASQLSATGQSRLHTHTIDSLGLSPSFVKLHLEGGELSALQGALGTIRTHRPIVAATIYHNDDGIWRTPHVLMQHLPNYRFLMRLHGWCGTGAVVYAIPTEREGRT